MRGYISQLTTEQVNLVDQLVLTIETFGSWAQKLVGQQNILEDDGHTLIRSLLTNAGVPTKHLDYFVDEVKYVQGRFPPDEREEYLEARRTGRGRAPAVPRTLRHRLLADVIEPYETEKTKKRYYRLE